MPLTTLTFVASTSLCSQELCMLLMFVHSTSMLVQITELFRGFDTQAAIHCKIYPLVNLSKSAPLRCVKAWDILVPNVTITKVSWGENCLNSVVEIRFHNVHTLSYLYVAMTLQVWLTIKRPVFYKLNRKMHIIRSTWLTTKLCEVLQQTQNIWKKSQLLHSSALHWKLTQLLKYTV